MSDKRDPATSAEIAGGRDATHPPSLLPPPEESLAFFQRQAAQARSGNTADSGRDSAVSDLPHIAIPGDGHAHGEGEDTKLTARQLAEVMQPRDANSPFRGFEDLSAIAAGGDTVPQGRRAAGQYAKQRRCLAA